MHTDPRSQEGFEAGVKGAIWRGKAPQPERDTGRGRLFRRCPECGAINPGTARYCQVDGVDLRDVDLASEAALNLQKGVDHSVVEAPPIASVSEQDSVSTPRAAPGRAAVWIGFASILAMIVILALVHAPSRPTSVQARAEDHRLASGAPAPQRVVTPSPSSGIPVATDSATHRNRVSPTRVLAATAQRPDLSGGEDEDWSHLPPAPVPPPAVAASPNELLAVAQPESNGMAAGGQQATGAALRQELIQELRAHGFGDFKVTVSAHRVVTIKGVSDDPGVKEQALMLARQHPSVTRVRDKIFLVGR